MAERCSQCTVNESVHSKSLMYSVEAKIVTFKKKATSFDLYLLRAYLSTSSLRSDWLVFVPCRLRGF